MKPRKKHPSKEPEDAGGKDAEIEDLRKALENLQQENGELLGKLQRVSADYANFQKRVPKQIADSVAYQKERVIRSLLPAMDNLEHTLANIHSADAFDVLVAGIQIIYDQLLDILKSHEVQQIEALGEKFNPALHEAMMQKSQSDQEDNIVLEEFQKGYTLNGRVIRPTKVIVNMTTPEETQVEEEPLPPEHTGDECETGDENETMDTE